MKRKQTDIVVEITGGKPRVIPAPKWFKPFVRTAAKPAHKAVSISTLDRRLPVRGLDRCHNEGWQESQFDDQAEAEYSRLVDV